MYNSINILCFPWVENWLQLWKIWQTLRIHSKRRSKNGRYCFLLRICQSICSDDHVLWCRFRINCNALLLEVCLSCKICNSRVDTLPLRLIWTVQRSGLFLDWTDLSQGKSSLWAGYRWVQLLSRSCWNFDTSWRTWVSIRMIVSRMRRWKRNLPLVCLTMRS